MIGSTVHWLISNNHSVQWVLSLPIPLLGPDPGGSLEGVQSQEWEYVFPGTKEGVFFRERVRSGMCAPRAWTGTWLVTAPGPLMDLNTGEMAAAPVVVSHATPQSLGHDGATITALNQYLYVNHCYYDHASPM